MKHKIRLVIFYLLLSFIAKHANAQTIWENKNTEAQAYLARMAQKGLIQLHDIIQPIERTKIANILNQLYQHKERLSTIELKELQFYLKEYNQDLVTESLIKNEIGFFVKDAYQRPRFLFIHTKDFTMNLDPNVSTNFIGGTGLNITQVSNGFNLWGKVGKKWGYQLLYRDVTELGSVRNFYTVNKLDFRRQDSKTGIILVGLNDDRTINHYYIRATINYSFKNG